ncbi:hypothetical protein [Rhodococcus sp. SORGH_AS_0303]|uniref:hypothetical protein n=1 Tax=Rhodococcus sp. SORGH_AS_0303 TaxID=3041753 RepID=UPI00278331F1|nr:hypothetical protein [Rhodococcus sp. SORGH_AS_0303]MDQ1202833.1 hypothetical protein [Rhodococcus sp. SORGH_AS_0303]
MTNEVSRTIDAVAFAAADLVQPITVLHAAGRFLLTEMNETDLLRWDVTQALGSIAAARKSVESATETLMRMVAKDAEAQGETEDRSGLTMWDRPAGSCFEEGCMLTSGHGGEHYADDEL